MRPLPDPDLGTRVIVAYKMARGTAALLPLVDFRGGRGHRGGRSPARNWPDVARPRVEPAGHASRRVGRSLGDPTLPDHRAIALACDGCFTLFEGWALKKRFPWGPWLVVGGDRVVSALELLELYRHLKLGRLVLLMSNLAVVGYLVRRKMLEPR